ncbi:MAG TPA: hypothetical protein PKV27_10445, partial [Ilumatobacteraceae bacterium]|nr:hypothetical protein [Ilumatobacteraceae bacterium]
LAVLTPGGQPDTTFGPRGIRTYDFGGASDFFWGAALNPARTHVALVGVRAVRAGQPIPEGIGARARRGLVTAAARRRQTRRRPAARRLPPGGGRPDRPSGTLRPPTPGSRRDP